MVVTGLLGVGCKDAPAGAGGAASGSANPSVAPTTSASALGTASASAAPAASAVDLDPAAAARPFLWVVPHEKGNSYLFGTMHLGADAERQLNPVVWEKLAETSTFIMEADVGSANPITMMKAAMLPADQSLDTLLGPVLWQKLVKQVGGTVPEMALKRFKPWFAVVTITQTLLPPGTPMDLVFQQKAKAQGKELHYLEELNDQIKLFDEAMTVALLKDTIQEMDKEKTQLIGLQKAYLKGDTIGAKKLLFDPADMKKYPKLYDVFFYRRNAAWMPMLEKHIGQGNAFIAVGAGHMLGEKGLIDLLKKKGIHPKRVRVSGKGGEASAAGN
ncbi:MAG: TraB/GumN family protein [Deltaproteobacteria bacterium]|nr:TraB/GumN family protein [Deltaproteobacteria bacterium]